MKFWVGITDKDWFDFLSNLSPPADEVNFWQPSAISKFQAVSIGGLFLFKLHSPLNYIAGGGFFISYSSLPISIAWQAFEEKNGAPSYEILRSRIVKYREQPSKKTNNPVIGCIVLTNPFFFKREEWLPAPKDWSPNIVRGKTYDNNEPIGSSLWEAVQNRLRNKTISNTETEESLLLARETTPKTSEYLAKVRLGQGAFRVLVTEAYNRKCAITGERTLPVLEASHIKPFSDSGPNSVKNGLLLRSDIHRLFDVGYLTINNEFRVEVSKRIKGDYDNGKEYYALQGNQLITLPHQKYNYPSNEFIEWRNQNVFVP
ncbi:HNH endonuclease [Desulfobacterota bacterium AH_259_B03_O07]|nr:HNH endonuclease [Desulfobacterota bacterium AH_259_B03_O07]